MVRAQKIYQTKKNLVIDILIPFPATVLAIPFLQVVQVLVHNLLLQLSNLLHIDRHRLIILPYNECIEQWLAEVPKLKHSIFVFISFIFENQPTSTIQFVCTNQSHVDNITLFWYISICLYLNYPRFVK